MKRNIFFILLLALSFTLLNIDQTKATTILELSFDQVYQGSELIFEGRVVSKETRPSHTDGNPFTYFTFQIIEVIKGSYKNSTIKTGYMGGQSGQSGDSTLKVSGMKMPEIGERGIYFVENLRIAFLLVGNITYTDARGKSPATISSKQHELRDIKTLHSLQLDFRLVGTIIAGEENSYAVILDETTGKQGMYKFGASINEATVLKIDKESIIVEKDGRAHILRITEGSYTEAAPSDILSGDRPPSIGVSEELPYFEPVFSETGPPVDENVLVKELPHFEPITNNTGPPVDDEDFHEDFPGFIPFESDSGPPGM